MHLTGRGSNSEAYREAYSTENMKPETVHVKACEVNSNGKVQERIAEILNQCQINEITPELIEKMLLNEAMNAQSDGARVQAIKTMAQVKAMLKDVREVVERTMTDAEIIESIAGDNQGVAKALRDMLGSSGSARH